MLETVRLAPANAVVLIEDHAGGNIPDSMGGKLFAATASCIAVGCKAEGDGDTEFSLATVDPASCALWEMPFEAHLLTPSRRVVVRTILGDVLLSADVGHPETLVRIWVNEAVEPDQVFIKLG